MKSKSPNVIVYAYSTQDAHLANSFNMINEMQPLVPEVHYNVSASEGAILLAYVTDDQKGDLLIDFMIGKDLFETLRDYQNNPIAVLCILLIVLTIMTIILLLIFKCMKKINVSRKNDLKDDNARRKYKDIGLGEFLLEMLSCGCYTPKN